MYQLSDKDPGIGRSHVSALRWACPSLHSP